MTLQEYVYHILSEKELRGQKDKRIMYHIGRRPALPKPVSERVGAKTSSWVSHA